MKDLRIYINGLEIDTSDQIKPVISKIVSEYRNPIKKTGSYSYSLSLPLTQRNKTIFNHQNNRQTIGKFRTTYSCVVSLNGIEIITGEFILNKITKSGFDGFIAGSNEGRIADIITEGKTLRDVQSYTPIDFTGDAYVWDRLDQDLNGNNAEICFPFVLDSFARIKHLNGGYIDGVDYQQGYDFFGISHFTKPLFTKIFDDAGYSIEGNVPSDETFNRLTLLYSNQDGESPAYNYGKMNPLSTKIHFGTVTTSIHDGDDYSLYCIEPEVWNMNTGDKTGDLSFSLGNDGVYTCRYTSNYTFDIRVQAFAWNNGLAANPKIESKQFLLFREIANNTTTTGVNNALPSDYNSVGYYTLTDYDTFNTQQNTTSSVSDNVHVHNTTFTAKLIEGKQYRPQLYIAVKKDLVVEKIRFRADNTNSWLKITAVQGKQLLNPADFLPKITQVNFVQALFKMFSLFYIINEVEKKITLYTRDEWYAMNNSNITDLTDKLSLDDFEETPLTDSEIAETYYKWSADESDHILSNTDYLTDVNAGSPDDSYELPFAPLAFIRQQVVVMDGSGYYAATGYDLLPVAIPATDMVDMAVLEDFTAASNFGYKPKLALYYGAGYMKDQMYYAGDANGTGDNRLVLNMRRTPSLTGGFTLSGDITFTKYKHLPKLGFFNLKDQPAYELIYHDITREFSLNKVVGNNIYTTADTNFLIDVSKVTTLDATSLALSGAKSTFQTLYKNDIAITDWSNFTEGTIRMTPLLYQLLTGRNIIRIDDDLYLLAAISNYDLIEDQAKVKLYKMISAPN